jgi:hypothetical protein
VAERPGDTARGSWQRRALAWRARSPWLVWAYAAIVGAVFFVLFTTREGRAAAIVSAALTALVWGVVGTLRLSAGGARKPEGGSDRPGPGG